MPRLRTGIVIVGYYATKIRRTLFAQNRELLKTGQLSPSEIARSSAELNRKLYEVLVDRMVLSKGDAIRVDIEYGLENGRIVWNFGSLKLSVYRRVDPDTVEAALKIIHQERLPLEAGE
ncbi:MAG: DUF2258 domain-containing protein [Nitrososphaerota archaeon]